MARPKKEGMDYFPHDTDAVNDEKIEALRMLYGNDGYAFYFILLERIYRNKNAELDVSDAETKQILSRKIGITTELFSEILETCLKRKCFDREAYEKRGCLTSEGVKNRALPVIQKRANMRSKYNVGVSDAETKQKGGVSAPKVKESKVKESKEKNKRIKEYTSNPLLIESLNDFIKMRKSNKGVFTDKALTLLFGKLDKLAKTDQQKIDILNQSIMSGWKGVFPIKVDNGPNKQNTKKDTLPSYIADQEKREKLKREEIQQKEETPEEEEARQKHIKEMMIALGEWDEDKN